MPTIWADDGNQYTMIDDGGTDIKQPGALWRQSLAVITGTPPHIRFKHVGDPNAPPPHTFAQIQQHRALWTGPLGPGYSSGRVAADNVFFPTEQFGWDSAANADFTGLRGIAYSTDRGQALDGSRKELSRPPGQSQLGDVGRGVYPDGYLYAIATEREFNASRLILGRSHPEVPDPSAWQWASGFQELDGQPSPIWSGSLKQSVPILTWVQHITYPEMAYDSPIHRYLLTFTYSYAVSPPAIWRNREELIILEAPHPWEPFSFVAHQLEFGPSNGYAPGIPIKWISRDGRNLWLKWSANFDGCQAPLDCSAGYGFNYRRLHPTPEVDR